MDTPSRTLRVIDFGRTSPLRSQTVWHAIAYGVSDGAPPTLSFVRPAAPYVSIGFMRDLGEVDLAYCRRMGLPVYRRMVGGGPVYLDEDQLFFQITLPTDRAPPVRAEALRLLLTPVVEAFRAQGVAALLDADHEIVVGDRKICGHGAGQIESAVVVVGNLIERFDHVKATRILRIPDAFARVEVLRLMRRFVTSTPIDAARFKESVVRAYAQTLALSPAAGALSPAEQARLEELNQVFESDEWLRGTDRPAGDVHQVKIRGGVRVCVVTRERSKITAAIVRGRLESVRLADPDLDGRTRALERVVAGLDLDEARRRLEEFGGPGERMAAALAKAAQAAS